MCGRVMPLLGANWARIHLPAKSECIVTDPFDRMGLEQHLVPSASYHFFIFILPCISTFCTQLFKATLCDNILKQL